MSERIPGDPNEASSPEESARLLTELTMAVDGLADAVGKRSFYGVARWEEPLDGTAREVIFKTVKRESYAGDFRVWHGILAYSDVPFGAWPQDCDVDRLVWSKVGYDHINPRTEGYGRVDPQEARFSRRISGDYRSGDQYAAIRSFSSLQLDPEQVTPFNPNSQMVELLPDGRFVMHPRPWSRERVARSLGDFARAAYRFIR